MAKMRIVVVLCVLALPGAMLAPAWRLAGLGAGEDDILYYFPMRSLLGQFATDGQWPWLNPWTGLGRPYVADPQTATWYPPTWLFIALPAEWAYPASLWVHYSLALWGMYRLLRGLTLERRAALFGGIAFAFGGFMLAHRAHFSMQHAAAWAPWVLWATWRYVTCATPAARAQAGEHATALVLASVRHLAVAAVIAALQCLSGHVQIAVLTATASLLFVLTVTPLDARGRPLRVGRGAAVVRWLLVGVCAAGLFAIQWVPTADYARVCTRVHRTYADFVENSWHPSSAVGWVLPMLLGQRTPNFFGQAWWGRTHQVEQFAYAGLVPLLLAALAVRTGWRSDPRCRPWLVIGGFGLLLALGEHTPLARLVYLLPGSGLFRVPARALVLVNLALAALAALAVHELGTRLSPQRVRLRAIAVAWTRRPVILGVALVVGTCGAVLLAWPWIDAGSRPAAWEALRPWNPAIWVPLVLAVAGCVALAFVARQWRTPETAWLLVVLTVVDLGVIGWTIDVPAGKRRPADVLVPQGSTEWVEQIRESGQRLWTVTGRRGGRLPGEYVDSVDKVVANTNILRGVETLTDYGPLQPTSLAERFAMRPWGESDAAVALLRETNWMRLTDVGWVLLCDEDWPSPADCDLVATTPEGWRLFRNASDGRAFLADGVQAGAVFPMETSPARLRIKVDTWPTPAIAGRAKRLATDRTKWPLVVMSRLAIPGWTATVDGDAAPVEVVDGLVLGVRVPPGEAVELVCSYFPPGLWVGAGLTLATAAVLLGAAAWSMRAEA